MHLPKWRLSHLYVHLRPTAEAHLAAITWKFYALLWLIRHLKNSGVPNLDVLTIYQSMVRPVLEFASPAFHPILTAAQSGHLERLQAQAYKIIFGWNVSYNTAINTTSTPRAAERRRILCQNFAKKNLEKCPILVLVPREPSDPIQHKTSRKIFSPNWENDPISESLLHEKIPELARKESRKIGMIGCLLNGNLVPAKIIYSYN